MSFQTISAPPLIAPIPFSERDRLQTLYRTELLDSVQHPTFDAITLKAAELFQTPIALTSLVDRHRQWFLSKVGLTISETPRSASLCSHAILNACDDILFVEDARQDPRFNASQVVIGDPYIRFYAGAPIIARGEHTIGVLCVLAPYPRPACALHERDGLKPLAKEASPAVNAILDIKSRQPALGIKPIDAHVGKRLQEIRARLGVTRNRLAFELGVSLRDVERMECGEMRMPADQLLTVSEFLAVPIADFFKGFSNPI